MAQWQNLLRLDPGLQALVSQLYEDRFPRHIRHSLCVPIESQDWDSAAVNENKAAACLNALLVYLEEQWNHFLLDTNVLQGPDFVGMRDYLLKHFKHEPLNLAVVLSECLSEEKKILASACEEQVAGSPTLEQQWRNMDNKVNELKRQSLEVKKEMKSLASLNERLDFIEDTWQIQVEQHVGLAQARSVVEQQCLKPANFIKQTKQMLVQEIMSILKLAEEIVVTLTDEELPEWKRRQQLACIGSPVDTCLNHLQKWFTTVAEVLLQVREQLHKLQEPSMSSSDASSLPAPVEELERFVQYLFTKLIANALVVEKQPITSTSVQRPLVLKTGVRFSVAVRFLANLPEFKDRLKVKPVFDKDVEETKKIKGFRHFDFTRNDCKVLDVDAPDGGLVAEFGHMSLKEVKSRTKGSEARLGVTEELHLIKFVMDFQHAGIKQNIEASSLPLIVITATSQSVSAWASVMWCNMLSTSEPRNLSLFVDPPALTWEQLSQVLGWQFLSVGQRALDENQLSMLRDKIMGDSDDVVHWSKFSKNESAWVWIDGILDLIKKHLMDLWRDGSIMGFVSRQRTQALLQEKPPGTFLLRFSESSKDGAITFSWVEHSNGEAHVHAVEPYSKQELSIMCLPDIIYHYSLRAQRTMPRNPLLYLYPDIHKDIAFGRYYKIAAMTAPKKVVDGYVDRTLIPMSVYPTPPPSPPIENLADMEVDTNVETDHPFDEILSELLDFSGLPDISTFDQQMPLTGYVDPRGSS